jgi:hypothetical protein
MNRLLERPFLHPFLFAVYPILLVYGHNQAQLTPGVALAPAALALGLALVSLAGSAVVLRNRYKAAVFTTLFLLTFFYFNQAIVLFNQLGKFHVFRGRYRMLLFAAVVFLALALVWRSRRSFRPVTVLLNAVGLFLVLWNAAIITAGGIGEARLAAEAPPDEPVTRRGSGPDIYHIVLDGYARSDTLRRALDYDNSAFERFLEDQGFYVARDSFANYPSTVLSMLATMNMVHLEPTKEFIDSLSPGSSLDHRVAQRLREHGYRLVNPMDEWKTAQFRNPAEMESNLTNLLTNEFSLTLVRTTMLDPLMHRFQLYGASLRRRIHFQLDALRAAPDIPGPKYVIVHILCPHPPYVFGPDGETVNQLDYGAAFDVFLTSWDNRRGYLDQVRFMNREMMEIIPEILASYGDEPPIIVLQSDHGPNFTRAPGESERDKLVTTFGILNAYYLPDGGEELLYPDISPVNSFRLIFSRYFGEDLPMLEDRSFYSDFARPFDLVEVTQKIRRDPF